MRKMNTPRFYFLVLVGLVLIVGQSRAQPTIYIVRHAEKIANWPAGRTGNFQPLSAEGVARAKKLAKQFAGGALAAIYSSLTTRTLHTAFPLSQKLKLPIQVAQACMDTTAIGDFLAKLGKEHSREDAVLLVSHSNIIPYLLVKAGLPRHCREEMGFAKSTDNGWLLIEGYDNIWKINMNSGRKADCAGIEITKF